MTTPCSRTMLAILEIIIFRCFFFFCGQADGIIADPSSNATLGPFGSVGLCPFLFFAAPFDASTRAAHDWRVWLIARVFHPGELVGAGFAGDGIAHEPFLCK